MTFSPGGDKLGLATSSSASRALSLAGTRGKIHVAVSADVTGADCWMTLTTNLSGASLTQAVNDGTTVLDFSALPDPPRTLKGLTLACGPGASMEVDWLSIQNSDEVVVPPGNEISFDWEDVDVPGGGLHTSVVRATTGGWLVAGTDVGGVGIKDPFDPGTPWRVINGEQQDFHPEVWDVAGVDWAAIPAGFPELYALSGAHFGLEELAGGLWRSEDLGETWELVADSLHEGVGTWGRADECEMKARRRRAG